MSEFPNDSETSSVVIKYYGMHSCSPLKPKRENQFTKKIRSSKLKACFVILSSLAKEGAEIIKDIKIRHQDLLIKLC